MILKYSALFFFLFSFQQNLFSQIVTVKDREDLSNLEFVTFISSDKSIFAATDKKGQVNFTPFQKATSIEVSRLGYKTKVLTYQRVIDLDYVILLDPKPFLSDQIIISASRWKERSAETPSRIAVLGEKSITIQQPQTSADLLNTSGQIFLQKSQLGGGSPMIRGFATNRLLISVDGVRMNTAIFRSGNLQNVINIDPFSVQQTEILFGPGSVMYGSDAIGGVMDFTTTKPQFAIDDTLLFHVDATTRYSSVNTEKTNHIGIKLGSQKWAYVGSATYFDFGDLRMGSHGPSEYLKPFYVDTKNGIDSAMVNPDPQSQRPTAYNQINTLQKLAYRIIKDVDLEYAFQYSTTSDYPRYDRLIRTKNGNPKSAVWKYGPQEWRMQVLTLSNRIKTRFYDDMVLKLAYQNFEESRIDRDFKKPTQSTRIEQVGAISASIDFLKLWSDSRKLSYGIEFITNEVKSVGFDENITSNTKVDAQSRYPQANWSSYAIFASYSHNLTEKLKLVTGARYNQYVIDATFDTRFYPFPFTKTSINDGALTGSLGAIWNPSVKTTLSAIVSTGFRTPNVDDLGKVFESVPGSVIVPNPDLKAEYAYNAELGFAQVFGEVAKWDVTVYYTLLDNALVRRDFQLAGQDSIMYSGEMSKVQAIQNAAEARVWGIQTGIDFDLWAGFTLQSRFSYQKGEEELDNGTTNPLRHASPWFGNTKIQYSVSKWRSELNLVYNGEVSFKDLSDDERSKPFYYAIDKNGNPYTPAYAILNFKNVYYFNSNWMISAGIENMFDLRYRAYSSGLVAPGRNVMLALKASF